jgi:2-succinyl-6-hydroxy-2,4-cyclohexadiene-1-carboxylate synthase
VTLHHRSVPEVPSGDRPSLVLVHGFTQNADCWGSFAERLSASFDLVLVDAPGHGRSHHDDASLEEAADLIGAVGGPAHYLGYSMGGRMLLHLALRRPELVRSLTLIGATAGIDDPAERADRRAADERLAMSLLTDGLEVFLDRWLALPLFAGLDETTACRPERLANRPEGLAASLRQCGTGTQAPLWEELDQIAAPVLLLAGSDDAKFTSLADRMARSLPHAHRGAAAGGHPIHSERPEEVAALVTDFVTMHDGP